MQGSQDYERPYGTGGRRRPGTGAFNHKSAVPKQQSKRCHLNFLFGLSDYNIPGEKYVLLLDIQMPLVSGIEVLKIVKNHEALKSLPVIMFSSLNDPQTLELCYRYGCNAFIPKPVDYNEFQRLSMLDFLSSMEVPDTPKDLVFESAS
jgi:CheY-like chemotaxis protein